KSKSKSKSSPQSPHLIQPIKRVDQFRLSIPTTSSISISIPSLLHFRNR
ncbi:MAG: hypothetical protein DVB23_002701, partial [Verrucomicrobia bacterium]